MVPILLQSLRRLCRHSWKRPCGIPVMAEVVEVKVMMDSALPLESHYRSRKDRWSKLPWMNLTFLVAPSPRASTRELDPLPTFERYSGGLLDSLARIGLFAAPCPHCGGLSV